MQGFLSGTASTGDDIVIQWLERGRGRVTVGGSEVHVQSGTMPTLLPEVQQFRFEYEDWDQRLVHLRRDLLLDVAAEHDGVNMPSTFDTSVTPDADAVGLWHESLRRAVGAFRSDGRESAAWRAARRDVARALLHLYPLREDNPAGRGAGDRVAAAVRYLHAHAQESITVVDLANASGLSVRGLQDAFQRDLKASPLAYLREVRLAQVRSELQAAERGDEAVATIARRWGFSHLGRFAAAYLARYGEYPRETLRLPYP